MSNIFKEVEQSYFEYLQVLAKGCLEISNEFRVENTSEAITKLQQAVQGMTWLIEIEEGMKKNQYDINSVMEKASEFLTEINDALEKRDYVFVADLFEYELQPLFEQQLKEKFNKIN